MIRLWRGVHSHALPAWIARAWEHDELLVLCPPLLEDFDFVRHLPAAPVEGVGELAGRRFISAGTHAPAYPEPPVLGVFTSGTLSATPRLVLYSKRNVEASLSAIRSLFDLSRISTVFCYPQPFHTFGLILGYVHSVLHSLKLETVEGKYQRGFHDARARLTSPNVLTLGTPTHFHDLLHHPAALMPSYTNIIGGARVPATLWQACQTRLKIEAPSIGYGATEASPGITHLPPGRAPLKDGEIGFRLPEVHARVIEGEGLEFHGPSLCLAIVQNGVVDFPRRFLARDRISQRADGVLVCHGRTDLVLNRGGSKISLELIEETLRTELGITAICVALPDERLGDDLGVVLENAQPETAAARACVQRRFGLTLADANIAHAERLPLNASAKIDRRACAKLFMEFRS